MYIQPGADQSTTPEGGKGVKHVQRHGDTDGARWCGEWMRGEGWAAIEWTSRRTRIMDEAANCDEIPRQFGEVRRNRRVRNLGMISRAGRVSGYDWFVDADWPSRGYRYRGPVIEPPSYKEGKAEKTRGETTGERLRRRQSAPPQPAFPLPTNHSVILARRSDTMPESRWHEVTGLRLPFTRSSSVSHSLSLWFSVSICFLLTRLAVLRKLLKAIVVSQPFPSTRK